MIVGARNGRVVIDCSPEEAKRIADEVQGAEGIDFAAKAIRDAIKQAEALRRVRR